LDLGPDRAIGPETGSGGTTGNDAMDAAASIAEVGGAIDSGAGVDGGSSVSCGPPQKAWGYGVQALTNVAWAADNTLVTGTTFIPTNADFGGVAITGNGSTDILVAKLDPATGKPSWVFTAGDSSDQWLTSTAVTSAGVGVIGQFKGTLDIDPVNQVIPPIVNPATNSIDYLMALSPTGKGVWSKKVNLAGGKLNAIAANVNQGFFVVCGSAMNNAANLGAVGTPGGGKDVVVAAIKASDGTVMWAKLFGGAMDQDCSAAAMDDMGNVALAGSFAGALDLGTGALTPAPTVASDAILWVATLNGASGAVSAAKAFGTTGQIQPVGVAFDGQGNVVVAGKTNTAVTFGAKTLTPAGLYDAFVAKLGSTALAPMWARRWGGSTGIALNTGVAIDSAGTITVVGTFKPTADTGPGNTVLQVAAVPVALETLIVSLDGSSGQTLCARNYGDVASSGGGAQAVAINHTAGPLKDRAVVVGNFTKVINFGGATSALSSGASAGYLLEP
jgi:hypothetical protein